MKNRQDSLPHLPEGWIWTSVRELSYLVTKGSTPTSYGFSYVPEGINFVKVENIENGGIMKQSIKEFITEETHEFLKRSQLAENDVLFSIAGTIGRVGIVHNEDLPANTNQAIAIIRCPWQLVNPHYLKTFLGSPMTRSMIEKRPRGVGMNNVGLEDVKNIGITFAPLNEQRRIVSRVEDLFSVLDAGVESLRKAKAQLRRYRQAVLRYAFEGRLTEEWRKTHKDRIETAQRLLEQVEQERLKKSKKSKRRKKTDSLDTSNLPQLPDGWLWTSFEGLAEDSPNAIKAGPFGSTLKKEFYVAKGFKIYGQEQVIRDDPTYGDYYINKEHYERLKSCAVKPGDILISLVGTIGKVLILPDEIEEGIINPRLVKLSLDKRLINPKYVKAYFTSSTVKGYFSLSSHGGTMDILNLSILKALPIGLPPLKEQEAITEELERTFSLSDELENVVDMSIRRAEKLRKSILKNAFEGGLVSQDPTDEPAEELLERIQKEKTKRETEFHAKRKRLS